MARSAVLRMASTPRCILSRFCSKLSRAELARSLARSLRLLRVSSPLIGANKTPSPMPIPSPNKNPFMQCLLRAVDCRFTSRQTFTQAQAAALHNGRDYEISLKVGLKDRIMRAEQRLIARVLGSARTGMLHGYDRRT